MPGAVRQLPYAGREEEAGDKLLAFLISLAPIRFRGRQDQIATHVHERDPKQISIFHMGYESGIEIGQ